MFGPPLQVFITYLSYTLYNNHYGSYFTSQALFGTKRFWTWSGCAHTQYYININITKHRMGLIWNPGMILGLRPANERRRYFVTTSLIGWAQT